ncbi:hypothetical protein [Helicobacter labacensis]|uniref:hypothetical protein n=1 Tax=Helicobacter labacensis TaxID=2316079 RepID=UPI000EACB6F3|nr:hypothetical protein [Helicobacter labacensis]
MWSERQLERKGHKVTPQEKRKLTPVDAMHPARLKRKNAGLSPHQQDFQHGRAGYEANVYHFLAQFFNTKLQRYSQNPQATSLLKNLLQDISAKKGAL